MNRTLNPLIGKGLSYFLDYERLLEISSKFNLSLVTPFLASLQITLRCNSKCSYCDIWKLGGELHSVHMMNLYDISGIFKSLRKLGVKTVSLTGGEPLMRNDLNDIVRIAKDNRLSVDICTNGIYLTTNRALELADAGVNCIILSLDTLDPDVYQKLRGVPFKYAERALRGLVHVVNAYPSIRCNINCVITRYNIGHLVTFVKQISKYGKRKISVNLQPYHRPPDFKEISIGLPQKMKAVLRTTSQQVSSDNLIPDYNLKAVFEKEIEKLIVMKKDGFPIANSELYLRRIPDFLFDNKLPPHFKCLAGYTSMVIRYDLKVLPCWRLRPIGDLRKEELESIWFSKRYAEERIKMKNLECQGCMLICHTEHGLYKS
jgi:MoaA/NifB/PqqE/SkfB family radical SAM enzyme